jgi:hypothetical protein
VEFTALVTSVTLNKEFQEMAGMFEVGDAVMTVPRELPSRLPNGVYDLRTMVANPLFEIGLNDKVTLMDDEYKTSEVLVKGTAMYGRPADTLINEKVTRIKSVRLYDTDTGESTAYTKDTDFTLDKNRIVWLEGKPQPTLGAQYSVTYFHRPVYIVAVNLPKPRHQDGQELPRYVVLRYLNGGVERK